MKKITFILMSMMFVSALFAQTPYTILSSKAHSPASLSAASQNNPWVGAKLAYNVSGDVSESFLLSARLLYVAVAGDNYAFPIVGNVGFNNADSVSADDGISLGIFPYYSLTSTGRLHLILHGGLNYHIPDRANIQSNEFRVMAGLEAAIFPEDQISSPITLSVAPEYVINTGLASGNYWGLNLTGVIPIANGLGALLEGSIPLDNGAVNTGLKIGVIVNNSID
jgi:uncharacterized membrane protein